MINQFKNILIVLLLFPSIIGAADQKDRESFRLAKRKVGFIELGMTIDSLLNQYNRKSVKLIDLESEGSFTPAIEIYIPGGKKREPSLVVRIEWNKDWVVGSIAVTDRRFKTDKGIGVGSAIGDLRKKYKIDNIGGGEGVIIARVEELGMSFELDQSHIPVEWYRTANDELLPNDIKIISVFIN